MNLNLEWVRAPRSDWIEDLESMAEGYPFEKRRKELRGDAASRCRSSWENANSETTFLAAYFDAKLVGWIRIRPDPFLSDRLKHPYMNAGWELIQRNRDDIRNELLDAIREAFPDSIIEFSQPSQNRTARDFYLSQPDVQPGPTDLLLGRTLGPRNDDIDGKDAADIGSLDDANETELEKFVPPGFDGYFSARSLLEPDQLRSLFGQRLLEWKTREDAGGLVAPETDPAFIALFENEVTSEDGPTPTGRISYIQASSPGDSPAAPDRLTHLESQFRSAGVEYVEARLDEAKDAEYELLRENGFEPLSKQMYFFRLPEGVTTPLEEP